MCFALYGKLQCDISNFKTIGTSRASLRAKSMTGVLDCKGY